VTGYFELLAEERGVVLTTEVLAEAGAPRRLWADETMLVRALSNLVSNALQFAPHGTSIGLLARVARDGSSLLRVVNDGPSIPVDQQSRIFERFYRVDASRQGSASGSGLGLAIVRSIMELHRGRATVESTPGHPTVFTLHFPAPAKTADATAASAPVPAAD
jgi:signal transduction histidine kinase